MKTRYRIDGSIYYITSNVYDRLRIFTTPSFVIPLIDSLNFYRLQFSTKLLGYVIMPDHLHLLIWPPNEEAVSGFMRDFKRFTSGRLTRQARIEKKEDWVQAFERAGKETNRAEFKIWQDDFWEETVFTDGFLRQKLNYIHLNPVRAGLVGEPGKYPYSSFRNYWLDDDSLIEIEKDWA
jgi:REP element-mobilizing transposase RayT